MIAKEIEHSHDKTLYLILFEENIKGERSFRIMAVSKAEYDNFNEGDNFALRKYLDTIVMSHLTIEQVLQALTEVYYAAVQMGREEQAQTIRQALMIE